MYKFIIIFLLYFTISGSATATNYYVDTTGNDIINGLSQASAWKTIAKLNSSMASLLPGDTVFFKRGQRFYGTLTITVSGSAANPLVFDAYGTGSAPEITGFYSISGWTTVPGYTNVWQCTLPFSRTSVSMLTKNKTIQPLGRWPNYNTTNGGYRTIVSSTSNTSLTDASNFPSSFVGGEAVTRSERWILDRGNITAQAGKTLTITPQGSSYSFIAGFGYFIQNHINCLDQSGEWAFDNVANKVYLYSSTNPNSDVIEVSMLDETVRSIDNITWLTHNNYKLRNLSFTGSNKTAMSIWLGSNVTIENDSIYNHGFDGINFFQTNNFKIRNCFFNQIYNNGIRIEQSTYDSIESNTMKNIATSPGRGGSGDVNYLAIRLVNTAGTSNSNISNNIIDSVGECGINFGNAGITVHHNIISNITMVLDDNGAIYSIGSGSGSNCYIYNNVCFNNVGCIFGSNVTQSQSKSAGIYLDQATAGVSVYNNISYNNTWGMILNNSTTHSIYNNTFCNNRVGVFFSAYSSPFITGNYFKYNTIFTKDSTQSLLNFSTPSFAGTSGTGSLDSNYYGRPLKRTNIINVTEVSPSYSSVLSLPAFTTRYGFDVHTYLHPTTYSNQLIDTLMFFYENKTLSPMTVTLPYGTFMDGKGVTVIGTFVLQPFTSRVVLKVSNSILPLFLVGFSAKENGCNALLNWNSTNEQNMSRFEIEKSDNGNTFYSAGVIRAAGSNNENKYSFTDNQPGAVNFYRLKMIDNDGSFTYSPVKYVTVNCKTTAESVIVYPNPVNQGFVFANFTTEIKGAAKLTLVNTLGQQIKTNDVIVTPGNNIVKFYVNIIPKGLYFIQLISLDNKPISHPQKIIVE